MLILHFYHFICRSCRVSFKIFNRENNKMLRLILLISEARVSSICPLSVCLRNTNVYERVRERPCVSLESVIESFTSSTACLRFHS